MMTNAIRPCFTTQHQTCKTKTKTKTTLYKTKTKTGFLVSYRSCPKTDGLRPHHWCVVVIFIPCHTLLSATRNYLEHAWNMPLPFPLGYYSHLHREPHSCFCSLGIPRVRTRDVREWLSTFPFPPIPIYSIPIPSHPHSQFFDIPIPMVFPCGLFPFPPIPILSMLKLYIISDTVIIKIIIIICS